MRNYLTILFLIALAGVILTGCSSLGEFISGGTESYQRTSAQSEEYLATYEQLSAQVEESKATLDELTEDGASAEEIAQAAAVLARDVAAAKRAFDLLQGEYEALGKQSEGKPWYYVLGGILGSLIGIGIPAYRVVKSKAGALAKVVAAFGPTEAKAAAETMTKGEKKALAKAGAAV
jgi:outer membrane murein-binding lipoprotein Lpp